MTASSPLATATIVPLQPTRLALPIHKKGEGLSHRASRLITVPLNPIVALSK